MFKSRMMHYKKQLGKDVWEQLDVGDFWTDSVGNSVPYEKSSVGHHCLRLVLWNNKKEIVKIIKDITDIKSMRKAMLQILESES